jgi:predicted MPP superfamily phosphohydrolase
MVDTLDADLIALTGDLVDGAVSKIRNDVAPLGTMKSRYGTFVCTGNHEYYAGAEDWIAEFRRLGMNVLLNQHAIVEHDGRKILIGGVTDEQGARFIDHHVSDPEACLAGAPGCDVKVLLAHRPGSVYQAAGFDLQLSGHTHGGQFFPWNLVVKLVHPYAAGLARHEKTWLYVSRGTGYFGPPFRLGAPSEITVLELVRA